MSGRPGQLKSPSDPPPRLGTGPLPAYRHVPGLTPHPVTHPDGHSYGLPEDHLSADDVRLPEEWRACAAYLEGIDLFNRAFLWEAHEAWEVVWHAAGHDSTVGRYLQGLIQVAAALLKRHLSMETGVANLLVKSRHNLQPAREWLREANADRFMGVALLEWDRQVRRHFAREGDRFPFLRVAD